MVLSRRALLIGGLGGLGLIGTGFVAALEGVLPGGVPLRRALGLVGEDGVVPDVVPVPVEVHRLRSQARGQDVDVVTMIPASVERGQLLVCLVLHGRNSSARGMLDLGLASFLAASITAGAPPLALVAVDGGSSYWVARDPADDPQAMLRDELPGWLGSFGLAGVPAAVLGISMGGFGALDLARSRGASAPAVAVLSPALFRRWDDAETVDAFSSEQSWSAHEPLRHVDELPEAFELGVWCGREDPFFDAAAELADRAPATVARFDHGEHTVGYWRRVLPDALRFVADRASS